jgi:hypothetical protein
MLVFNGCVLLTNACVLLHNHLVVCCHRLLQHSNTIGPDDPPALVPQVTPTPNAESISKKAANPLTNPNNAGQAEPGLQKYKAMQRAGVPAPAIRQKMAMDGMGSGAITTFFGATEAVGAEATGAPSSHPADEDANDAPSVDAPLHGKYKAMERAGVPLACIRQRKMLDGALQCQPPGLTGQQQQRSKPTAKTNAKLGRVQKKRADRRQ